MRAFALCCACAEWSKHGTCAEQLPSLASELAFFQTTLQLNNKCVVECG